MDDLISRQDTLQLFETAFENNWTVSDTMDALENLPSAQPEPKWIPCSERMPERGVSVLISHVGYVSVDFLDIDDGALFFWISALYLDEERQNIAWMPLPEPWKGEANKDDRHN